MAIASAVAFRVVVGVLKVVVVVVGVADGGFVPTSGSRGGSVPPLFPGIVLPPAPGASVGF
jgi:hypothetical protein